MTKSTDSPYEFENVNPNTYLHQVLTCKRCNQTMGLVEAYGTKVGRILCYSCYKEMLKKN
jgi:hypothetical protein